MIKVIRCCLLIIFSFHANAENDASMLFNTINERLSYMEDVALFKAVNHLPIEDSPREKRVIASAQISAATQGLDSALIKDFFKAQIDVAKAIQYRYRADLLSQPRLDTPKDLSLEIRPHLIRLGDSLIVQLSNYIKKHGQIQANEFETFNSSIEHRYISDADKVRLFNALMQVDYLNKPDSNKLD